MQKTISKNKVHDISTSLVDIKKKNPDFQISAEEPGSKVEALEDGCDRL